jgi:hypothetical protein
MRELLPLTTVAIFITVTAALAGCTARFEVTPEKTNEPSASETTESTEDVFALGVGDCLNAISGNQVAEVPVVPCEQAHDEEVYFEFDIEDAADYPGEEAVIELARTRCLDEFETFVGMAYEDSVIDYYPLYPTADGWETANDRTIQCVVWDTTGQVTGTLADARR